MESIFSSLLYTVLQYANEIIARKSVRFVMWEWVSGVWGVGHYQMWGNILDKVLWGKSCFCPFSSHQNLSLE